MSQDSREDARKGSHLLVVDDDDRIRSLLKDYLGNNGYRVSTAANAARARSLMLSLDFDLLILDVMMPGEDGFSLTKGVREKSRVPILLLTARGESTDRIEGLTAGADDYLAKPFEPEELLLRIDAILRRAQPAPKPETVRFGDFRYALESLELAREDGEDSVRLTQGEAALLTALAANPGKPMEREALAARTGAGSGRAVDVQVARLRRKIEADPRAALHLQTVRGAGYKLIAEAEEEGG